MNNFLINSFFLYQGGSVEPNPDPVGRVPKGSAFTTDGTQVVLTNLQVGVNELVVVSVSLAHRSASAANVSISDTAALTWTKVQRATNDSNVDSLAAIFYAVSPSAQTISVTVTSTVSGTNSILHAAAWGYEQHNGVGSSGTSGGVNINEEVAFSGSTSSTSELLGLLVASRKNDISLSPVAPAAALQDIVLAQTAGSGLNGSAGASFRSSLIAAQGIEASGSTSLTPTEVLLTQATATSNTVTTSSVTTTNGRLLVAIVVSATSAAAHPVINSVSGGGLTWTERFSKTGFDTYGIGCAIYTATATGGSITVTPSFTNPGGNNRIKVYLYEVANVSAIGLNATGEGDASSGSGATITLPLGGSTASNSLVFSVITIAPIGSLSGISNGSGWTELHDESLTVGAGSMRTQVQKKTGVNTEAVWSFTGDEFREAYGALELVGVTTSNTAKLNWTMSPNDGEYAQAMVAIEVKKPEEVAQTGSVRINLSGNSGSVNGAVFSIGSQATNITYQAESMTLLGGENAPINQGSYVNGWKPQDISSGVQFVVNAPNTGTYSVRLHYSSLLGISKKTVKVGGITALTATFPVAGASWTDFTPYIDIQIPLVVGANTVQLISDVTSASNGWVNLDRAILTQAGSPLVSGTVASGFVVLNNVPPGSHTITQTTVPSGYGQLTPQVVTVTSGQQTVLNLTQPSGSTPPPPVLGSLRVTATATNGSNVDGTSISLSLPGMTTQNAVISSGQAVFTNLTAATYTVTVTSVPSGLTVPSAQSAVVTAGNETVVPFSISPSGSTVTPPAGQVVIGHTNVAQRRADPPNAPTGSGILRQPAASVSAIQAAINAAQPGDCIEVAAGSYSGNLTFSSNGTEANPILIRPALGQTVRWTGGQWTWLGNHHICRGFTFAQQDGADRFYIDGTARYIRVFGNTFDAVGNNTDATINGIFKIMSGPGSVYNSSYVTVVRDLVIDRNVFINSRNCIIWTWPRVKRIFFEHNRVTGRGLNLYNESEAIKFGPTGFRDENAESYIGFNTIEDWFSNPYVIGYKMGGVMTVGNWITRGRLELRGGGNYIVSGNVILDGDIAAHDTSNRLSSNWVRTIGNPTPHTGGLGGLLMLSDTQNNGIVLFTRAFKNSVVEDNVFWTPSNSTAWIPMWARAEFQRIAVEGYNGRPRFNTFRRNVIAKSHNTNLGGSDVSGPSHIIADTWGNGIPPNTSEFISLNTWTENTLYWSGGTANPVLPGSGNQIVTTQPTVLNQPPTTLPIPASDLIRP